MDRSSAMGIDVSCQRSLMIVVVVALGSGGATSAQELRYRIEPNQVVPYRVTIVVDTPAETDTMSGVIAFSGKKSEPDQFAVKYQGGLTRKKQAKSSGGSGGPGGFRGGPRGFGRGPGRPGGGPPRSPMSRFGSGISFDGLIQTSNELVVGRTGEIKSLTGESQLPYLMGNLSLLPFEALPDGSQKNWQWGSGISITEGSTSRIPRGPFGRGQQETTSGGSESASYSIQSDDGKRVMIKKTYRLHSPAATEDDHAMEITGSGTFVFNRELGVPESLDFKQNLAVSGKGSSVTVPMTVAWNRISDEEYQAHLKARADQFAALRQKTEQRKAQTGSAGAQPLDSDTKNAILAELRSDNVARVHSRLARLRNHKLHPSDTDLAHTVRDLQSHKNGGVSMAAKQVWKKWSVDLESGSSTGSGGTSKPGGADPFATVDKQPGQMRVWSDASGSFKVEAMLLKIDGNNVVLKRKDGKELSVPIDRLSKADQAVVASLKGTAKPDNPFD